MIEGVSREVKTGRASNEPAEAVAFVEDMAARKGERKEKRSKGMLSQRSRVGTEGAEGGRGPSTVAKSSSSSVLLRTLTISCLSFK